MFHRCTFCECNTTPSANKRKMRDIRAVPVLGIHPNQLLSPSSGHVFNDYMLLSLKVCLGTIVFTPTYENVTIKKPREASRPSTRDSHVQKNLFSYDSRLLQPRTTPSSFAQPPLHHHRHDIGGHCPSNSITSSWLLLGGECDRAM